MCLIRVNWCGLRIFAGYFIIKVTGHKIEKKKAEVDISLSYGSPSVKILKIISEQKIFLVVMGSQGRGFVKELFLGSVSNNIVRHAKASVLLIPAKR